MNILAITTRVILVSSVITTLVLLIIILARSQKKIINNCLALMLIGIAGWSAGLFSMIVVNKAWATIMTFASPLIGLSGQILFTKIYPKNEMPKKISEYWFLLPAGVFFVLSFFPDMIFSNVRIIEQYYIKGDNGPFGPVYSLTVTFFVLYPLYLILKKIIQKNDFDKIIKTQLKYLAFGFTMLFLVNMFTNSILPVFFGIYFFNGIGPVFSLLLAGFILYIISRYQFLEIRKIIQRSFVYAVLLGIIISVYLSMVFIVGQIFQRTTNTTIILSAGLTAIIGIFGSQPIEKYFSKLTDRIFFKDKYDYSKALRELSEIMNVNLDLKILLEKTVDKLEHIFKTNKIEVIIKKESVRFDGEKLAQCTKDCPGNVLDKLKHYHEIFLFSEIPYIIENRITNNIEIKEALKKLLEYGTKNNFEVYVPILLKGKALGMMLIGEKLSGDSYNQEDLNLLGTFSYQMAIALEKSRLYEAERKYAGELEEKVKARTAKIEKLQQEQKQMMIDISHGLQTPLAIVKGESEFLQEELPDNKHVKVFEKSIDQVSKFIYDMLNLARLETTEESFLTEKVDLSGLMDELVEYFDVLVKENNIKIEKDIEPGISVMGRKDKLEEMINNLVSNSIKYIDNERVIKISLKKNKDKVRLVVEDTGMGINAMFIPNLFNRFYRVKDEKHAGIKGTGIGLSIVKQIVEKHGGTIRAESMEGKWTKMIVELKTTR